MNTGRKMIMTSVRCVAGMLLLGGQVMAASAAAAPVPDLTKGEKRDNTPDCNLGPTGAKGWVFARGLDTSEARQILITGVEKGSPADGVLETNDVILGVNGKAFGGGARVALGQAVTEAESEMRECARMLYPFSRITVRMPTSSYRNLRSCRKPGRHWKRIRLGG
jgi:hypothetical protein